MNYTVVDQNMKKVGSVELPDEVFGHPVKEKVLWEQVKAQRASRRRGTHKTKKRGEVRGGGIKPYKQKGTGRPQVGSSRTPLWRKGGTVFGPQPRSYAFDLPKKVRRGALRAALAAKAQDGALIVVDRLTSDDRKTKSSAELLKRLGVTGKTLLIDVAPEDGFSISVRNLTGVKIVQSSRVTARDVMDTAHVIATKDALEKLQEALG